LDCGFCRAQIPQASAHSLVLASIKGVYTAVQIGCRQEKMLAQIWAEVLSVKQVGISDNFFDLGGHSLTATRIVSRVIQRFQLNIPLHLIFASPTIAAMATLIEAHQENTLSEEEDQQLVERTVL
jgi:acyl carrier protein